MKKFIFYVKAHWQGNLPLNISFFVNFVVAIVIARGITYFAFVNVRWDSSPAAKIFLSYVLTFCISVVVWSTIGALRSLIKRDNTFKVLFLYLIVAIFTVHSARFLYGIGEYIAS